MLKRQSRNGVPLLRRLQASTAGNNRSQNDDVRFSFDLVELVLPLCMVFLFGDLCFAVPPPPRGVFLWYLMFLADPKNSENISLDKKFFLCQKNMVTDNGWLIEKI